MNDFIQYLVLLLIGLLFAKDYLLPPLLRKLGLNGESGIDKRICDLSQHAKIANEEMGEVKERLTSLEAKMDILMRHFKI